MLSIYNSLDITSNTSLLPNTKEWFEKVQHVAHSVLLLIGGIIGSIVGYFEPIKSNINLMIGLFFLDALIGITNSVFIKREKFDSSKLFGKTGLRILGSGLVILIFYMIDQVHGQSFVSTYNILSYAICGAVGVSILLNIAEITKMGVFKKLANIIKDKIKSNTGVDISDNDLK